ncbi:PucR family transcriptional regulator [Paenarthrobacter nicotinovorans]|uniref:Putative transcriptional regulator n=1 Tax=Paenarthrobacter nicotinovorans TaxID=29320 RepID=Q8GAH7_PAENI|nr:helix-turn-helix domain-containing protein [Paenarthrobacter nicotinovorans]MBP2396892.1 DNA-binding PucR family transcriptional regulator [Paenarthrobacter nicotinovorans]UKF06096.1 putative transcriptional regulator/ helix-turn-helix domain-containing protein [Paenarthrobacter nicotinovorans]CAD47944.1 putative transcriptional regulator [Paenarthrobacter nicotinovorans]
MIQTQHLSAVSVAITSDINQLSDSMVRRLHDDVQAGVGLDPALAQRRSERLAAALLSISRALSGSEEPDDKFLAEATLEARETAQAGVDLLELIHTYRVLQSATWDVLLDLTTTLIPDASQQLEIQKWVSQLQHRWHDVVVANVIDAYRSEQHRFFYKSEDHRLRNELRDFIAGRRTARPNTGYPFEGQHLSVVAWGNDPKGTIDLAATLINSEVPLVLESTGGAFLGWLAVKDGQNADAQVIEGDFPDGAHLALGSIDKGFSGFRRSHQRAWRAYKVGRLTGARITRYTDVALEAVFATNMQAVRDLVLQQLGPLLADPRKDILCDTLRAYFSAGCNAVAAAAALQVHERTVAYRLRSIEERLGISVAERHVELLVALRLYGLLKSIAETDIL